LIVRGRDDIFTVTRRALLKHPKIRKCLRLLPLAASLLALVTLLCFPSQRTLDFVEHFAGRPVCRSVERHTFMGQSKGDATAQALPRPQPLESLVLIEERGADHASNRLSAFEAVPQVPLPLLLSRLKLAKSRSGSQDPLL
jgi:hypothetical protein